MTKTNEAAQPTSCWNKALANERMFITLTRDLVAPEVVNFWCDRRIAKGLNKECDDQIQEARKCAALMLKEREGIRAELSHQRTRVVFSYRMDQFVALDGADGEPRLYGYAVGDDRLQIPQFLNADVAAPALTNAGWGPTEDPRVWKAISVIWGRKLC